MPFKAIKRKVKKRGEIVKVNGKPQTIKVFKDGVDGTGVTLPFSCGFCKEVHFRSRKQRNRHTQSCPE